MSARCGGTWTGPSAGGGPVDGLTIKYVQIGDRGPIRFKPEWLAQFVNDHAVPPLAKPLVYEAKKRKTGLAALL
ncbi:MAG: hypothetical protein ABFD16_20770 [Thermoguttaceae bacterium]